MPAYYCVQNTFHLYIYLFIPPPRSPTPPCPVIPYRGFNSNSVDFQPAILCLAGAFPIYVATFNCNPVKMICINGSRRLLAACHFAHGCFSTATTSRPKCCLRLFFGHSLWTYATPTQAREAAAPLHAHVLPATFTFVFGKE